MIVAVAFITVISLLTVKATARYCAGLVGEPIVTNVARHINGNEFE